jgi:hypothetical protein
MQVVIELLHYRAIAAGRSLSSRDRTASGFDSDLIKPRLGGDAQIVVLGLVIREKV